MIHQAKRERKRVRLEDNATFDTAIVKPIKGVINNRNNLKHLYFPTTCRFIAIYLVLL